MKILYVITKANFGGAQKYVFDLSTYFVSQEHDVLVVHGENEFGGENTFINKMDEQHVLHKEIQGLKRELGFLREVKVLFFLVSLFRKEKPDVVHLNSSKIGVIGGLAARALGVPRIVFTAHGLPHNESRPLWQRILIKWITWLTFILVHKVILVSERELQEVEKWWGVKNKVTRIYNGVGEIEFTSEALARATLSECVGIDLENKVILGSIAELTKNKGLLEFMHVLAELKEKHSNFVYVHFGTGEQEKELKKMTDDLDLTEHVFWLGFDKDAGSFIKAFDIFTLPSLKEGLPYALLEAGRAGVAVAASSVGGIPEIIINKQSGLIFQPGNTNETVGILKSLVDNKDVRCTYAAKLTNRIQSKFSIHAMLANTTKAYGISRDSSCR